MKKVLWLCFVLCIHFCAYAQSVVVTGVITDTEGEPIPGVSVLKVNSQVGTVTDLDGRYTINANRGDQLRYSFVGFESQTLTVGSSNVLSLSLQTDISSL
jgi:TonB-dependent starch-binding outer membrane protein SusC